MEALTTVSVTFLKPGFLVTVAKLYLEKVCVTDVSDYYWNPTHYLQICVDNSCPWTQITISDSAWTAGCFIISHNCSVITFPALTCSLGLVISPCFSFQLRLLTLQLQLTAAPPDSARGLFLFWANISTLNNHQLFSKFILVDLQFKSWADVRHVTLQLAQCHLNHCLDKTQTRINLCYYSIDLRKKYFKMREE